MELATLVVAVFTLTAIGLFMLRATKTRPSHDTDLANGTVAGGSELATPDLTPAAPMRTVIAPAEHPFPMLQAIDHARGAAHDRFATDLHAAMLEQHARTLVADWWSDTIWVTGLIGQRQLDALVLRLEHERERLREQIRIVIASDAPAGIDAPIHTG